MKTLKLTSLMLVLSLMSSCNAPKLDAKLSSIPARGFYDITGAFKNGLAIDVETKSGAELYVQNGKIQSSISRIDLRKPSCTLNLTALDISSKKILNAYDVSKLYFSKLDTFFKQAGHASIDLRKSGNKISIKLSDRVHSDLINQEMPNMLFYIKLNGTLDCRNPLTNANETSDLTVGELMNIFQFEYFWVAPAV